jgi:hypothetical protein
VTGGNGKATTVAYFMAQPSVLSTDICAPAQFVSWGGGVENLYTAYGFAI